MSQNEIMESREPYWEELDNKGKIERMRERIKNLEHLTEDLHSVVIKLEKHCHDKNGKLLLPFQRELDIPLVPRGFHKKNDKYF